MINVQCPACGTRLKVSDEAAGKTGKCPDCGAAVKIPEAIYEAEDVAEVVSDGASFPDINTQSDEYRLAPEPAPSPSLGSSEPRRSCPMCGEMILATAAKCRFCGEILDSSIRSKGTALGQRVDPKVIKRFRKEMHGLAGLWIFIGGIALLAGLFLMGQARLLVPQELVVVIIVMSLVWIGIGVFVGLKHMWAVYVGLVLSYLSALGNVVQLANGSGGNVLSIILLVAGIVQAHRSITSSKKLRAAGIPLTAKA